MVAGGEGCEVVGEGGQARVEAVPIDGGTELLQQGAGGRTGDEGDRGTGGFGELFEEVLAGEPGVLGGQAHGIQERGEGQGEFALQGGHRRGQAEGGAGPGQGDGARGPCRSGRLVGAVRPQQLGSGTRGGRVAQQVRLCAQPQQGGEDRGGVAVVDAALVALVVAGLGGHADDVEQAVLGRCLVQAVQRFGPGQQRRGQVFGAVDLGRLGDQVLVPVRASGLELRVGDGRAVVGAGQGEGHRPLVRNEGELGPLSGDGEAVAAEADGGAAVTAVVQVGAVAQGAGCALTRGLGSRPVPRPGPGRRGHAARRRPGGPW